MHNQRPAAITLIYFCSGCSNAAQMANYLAARLDCKNIADMSCIVDFANMKKLVHIAKSGIKIIVIDGCALAYSKACLSQHSAKPDIYVELTALGVKKNESNKFRPPAGR